MAWFVWGAVVGLAIAIARLPLDTNLVPVLSAAVFSGLILKEAIGTEPLIAVGALTAGAVLGWGIDLVISPPCAQSGVEIVVRAGRTVLECSRFVETKPLMAAAAAGAFAILGVLIWVGRRERSQRA